MVARVKDVSLSLSLFLRPTFRIDPFESSRVEGKLHSVAYLSITFLELIDQQELRVKHTIFRGYPRMKLNSGSGGMLFFRIESMKFRFKTNGIEFKRVKLDLPSKD